MSAEERDAKRNLERQLAHLMADFEESHPGLIIADVDVSRVDWTGIGDEWRGSMITSVTLDVRLS